MQIIHGVLEMALQNGIVLERWKCTVTALIEKKTGTPYLHKFRVIHVVEGDLQFLSKYFYSYRMMRNAESQKSITDK